jgi:hypothetical protein
MAESGNRVRPQTFHQTEATSQHTAQLQQATVTGTAWDWYGGQLNGTTKRDRSNQQSDLSRLIALRFLETGW